VLFRAIDEAALVGGWYTHPDLRQYEAMARDNWEAIKAIQWIDYTKLGTLEATTESLLKTVDTDPERVKLHTQLLLRVRDWESRGRSPSALLRGDELNAFEDWRDQSQHKGDEPRPTEGQIAFIAESRRTEDEQSARDAQRERRIRQFRLAAAVLGCVGALAVIAAVGSAFVGTQAQERADTANTQVSISYETLTPIAQQVVDGQNLSRSLQFVASANKVLQDNGADPRLAVLLNIRGLRTAYSPQGDLALMQSPDQNEKLRVFAGHSDCVTGIAFSPDGRYVLTGSWDNTARLWDVTTGPAAPSFYRAH
jgi:hypothetical protein